MLGYYHRPSTVPFYVCKYTNSCAIGKISTPSAIDNCHLLAHHNKFSALRGAQITQSMIMKTYLKPATIIAASASSVCAADSDPRIIIVNSSEDEADPDEEMM